MGAAESCRRIDRACAKHKRWKHFSDKQKDYVKDLVAYNEGDCRSTWLIALKVGNSNKKTCLLENFTLVQFKLCTRCEY